MDVLATIWEALNSPFGIAAVAAVVLWALNKLYLAKPEWAKYEGLVIQAVRWAEKQIPDANAGLHRFDKALQYILKLYKQNEGKVASASLVASFKEGISLVHNNLEAEGALKCLK